MASFAKIGLNNKVIEVLSVVNEVLHDSNGVEQEINGIDFLTKLTGWAIWKQTSYNTHGGVHSSGGIPLRKNFAGIGYTYDEDRDAFISKKPFNSWILNEQTCNWESPIPMPSIPKLDQNGQEIRDEDNFVVYNQYQWNEQIQNWELING
jgi:hypothetical protein